MQLDDAARERDRKRVPRADPRPLTLAHEQSRERWQAAGGARSELLELCAATVSVPGISLALLTPALGVARRTVHGARKPHQKPTRSGTSPSSPLPHPRYAACADRPATG